MSRVRTNMMSVTIIAFFLSMLSIAVSFGDDRPFAADLDPTLPAVIKASVFFDPTSSRWVGSGTAIATDGEKTLVLTCEHVLSRGNSVEVGWYDGTRSKGRVFYRDENLDVAIALVAGGAPAIAPLSVVETSGKIWAIGFPNRTGPTTRRATFDQVNHKGRWIFNVDGEFGKGASGSGVFQAGRLISLTTGGLGGSRFKSTALGVGRNELIEFVKKSAKSAPEDCPFNLLDPFGLFQSMGDRRNRDRGRSEFDIDPNIKIRGGKQIPGLLPRIPGLDRPRQPPIENDQRLDKLEDSLRNLRDDLLRDVKDILRDALTDSRQGVSIAGRSIGGRTDNDIEDEVEAILEAEEKIERDKAKLLSELRRRSEAMTRLAEQLEDEKKD